MKKKWPNARGREYYKDLQRRLFARISENAIFDISRVNRLLAIDVSYKDGYAVACGVLWEIATACPSALFKYKEKVIFPYISGLFFIRELPPIANLVKHISTSYDVLLLNAAGTAHPEGIGLATHAGLYLKKPSIGTTERIPYGFYKLPGNEKNAKSEILNEKKEVIGYVVRTQSHLKPIFVTPGYGLDAKAAISIVMALPFKARLPEPLRIADRCSKKNFEKDIKIRGCENKTIHSIQYPPMTWKKM